MASLVGASASSSMASASSSSYDVFINHRGPDVKKSFASHLYRRLSENGLRAFLDRDEMEKGGEISSQIDKAIRGASVHIAIFSPRYAESDWCLHELVLMMKMYSLECPRVTILPIFYKIDPSVVRWTNEKGAYFEALRALEQKKAKDSETGEQKPRYGVETVQSWRDALSSVANLNGFTLGPEDDEVELLDRVVKKVLKKVPKTPLDVAKYPTGLDLKLEEFGKMVERERVKAKVIGIVGVGGVGKTTLAKHFFNNKRSFFSASSFLSDVREVAGRMSLTDLQSKLIKELKHKDVQINRHEGIKILKKHLSLCEALIILDNVDHVSQLDAFLPIKDVISPTSLILVTSRDKHVLKASGILESSIYNLQGLDLPQSKELFCSHAFNQSLQSPEVADLVDEFVTACKGLPLSLKVIGALLCGENDRCYWQDQLERLNQTLPDEILKTLRFSYDSLSKQDQPIFLDIACFFIGEDIDKGIRIWGMAGLRNLQNKCLLEVDTENKIKMHDHIRDMGRSIAKEQTMPLRLWDSTTNIIDNLSVQQSTVIREVRGINILGSCYDDLPYAEMDWFRDSRLVWKPNEGDSQKLPSKYVFNNSHIPAMRNLQVLVTAEDQLDDMLSRVQPPHLIWLRWNRISHSSLPDWIPMKDLKVLEVGGDRLNMLWPHESQGVPFDLRELNISAPLSKIPKSIGQLKYLERIAIYNKDSLGADGALERLPDEFCRLRSLKYLVFTGFSKMVSLPDSFGDLTNLQHIDFYSAHSLQTLPDSFGKLTRLKHLSLSGCNSLTISNGMLGDMTTLEYLNLSLCKHVNELPPQVVDQPSLQELYLEGTRLKELRSVGCNLKVLKLGSDLIEMLPPGLGDLKSLKSLSVSDSPQLKSLPDSVGLLTQLTELNLRQCGIEYLPGSLLQMNMLESLNVYECPVLEHPFKKEVEGERETEGETGSICMFGLKRLCLTSTEIREVYFDEGVCPNLQQLTIERCSELRQIGGLCGLPKLRGLSISGCAKVELSGLVTLTSLEELIFWRLDKLQSIPWLGQLTTLRNLKVCRCCEIQALPDVGHLTCLESLSFEGCVKLQSIPGLGQLTKLRKLDVSQCHEIPELPGVEHLTSLEELNISGLWDLKSIPGLGHLTQIRELNVSYCIEISELPGVEQLTSLEELNIKGLRKLNNIQGLGQLTQLRELNVSNCHEISELPGVEHLTSLEKLDISGLRKLESIPGLGQLSKLRELNVSECHEISELPGVEHLTSLEELNISYLWKLESIQRLGQLTQLIYLNVGGCYKIAELAGVEHLTSLEKLNISGLSKLESIQGLGQLTQLRELDVSQCHEIRELPGVEHLTSLVELNINGLWKLESIQWLGQLTQLTELDVSQCHEIPELLGVEHLTSLKKLNISGLSKLESIQWLGQLTQLRELNVSKCHEISELPGVEHLTSLEKLDISELGKLESIPGLGQLSKLRGLNVSECHEISELPGVEHLTSLERLNISGLSKLESIQGLGQLTQLTELDVSECHKIPELPGVEHLTSLVELNISGLSKLESIQWLGQLTQLRELNVSKCYEISELPGVEHLTFLERLNISGLSKLESIQGLGQLTQLTELDVSECHKIPELPGVEHLTFLERLNISGLSKLESIQGLGQLTQLTELDVSTCCELRDLPGVEYLTSLEIVNACECPKLRWRKGILKHLRQQLKENFRYESQKRKR